MAENGETREFLFKPVPSLGIPNNIPVPSKGYLNATARFVIPGLQVGKSTKEKLKLLSQGLGVELIFFEIHDVKSEQDKPGLMTTFCFSVSDAGGSSKNHAQVVGVSHLLIERMVGILSFCAGTKLQAIQRQYCIRPDERTVSQILGPGSRSGEQKNKFVIPSSLMISKATSDEVFSALFWLRRGMGEVDPLVSFSALMLSLQISARAIIEVQTNEEICPKCGEVVAQTKEGDTALVKRLLTEKLGADPKTAKKLWEYRNAVIAHGGKQVTAEIVVALTEAKFEAGTFAYKALGLALNIEPSECPAPTHSFFVTDAFMNLD
jgi:hypothetical protein